MSLIHTLASAPYADRLLVPLPRTDFRGTIVTSIGFRVVFVLARLKTHIRHHQSS